MQSHQLAIQRFANTVILPLASLFRVCGFHRRCHSSRLSLFWRPARSVFGFHLL